MSGPPLMRDDTTISLAGRTSGIIPCATSGVTRQRFTCTCTRERTHPARWWPRDPPAVDARLYADAGDLQGCRAGDSGRLRASAFEVRKVLCGRALGRLRACACSRGLKMPYDVVVIGSGFGGAITACRLAERGYRVLVLERGRRWNKTNYPRELEDPWVWSNEHPERENGWLDLRVFSHVAVAAGAGVGGGSLVYANVSCEAPPRTFDAGWPKEVTYAELKPHYDAVAEYMNVQCVPDNQWTSRMRLIKEAADASGYSGRFKKLELAVSFDPAWTYDQSDPCNALRSKPFVNAHGAPQGTCVHLGNC